MEFLDNEFHVRTNRQDAIKPKSHTEHWCEYCDRDRVCIGEKCTTCGNLSGGKRLKKDSI